MLAENRLRKWLPPWLLTQTLTKIPHVLSHPPRPSEAEIVRWVRPRAWYVVQSPAVVLMSQARDPVPTSSSSCRGWKKRSERSSAFSEATQDLKSESVPFPLKGVDEGGAGFVPGWEQWWGCVGGPRLIWAGPTQVRVQPGIALRQEQARENLTGSSAHQWPSSCDSCPHSPSGGGWQGSETHPENKLRERECWFQTERGW